MAQFDETQAQRYVDEAAQRRLDAAVAAGRVAQEQAQLAEQLSQTESQYLAAWRAAMDAGWSETELKRLGLAKPSGRGGRSVPRRRRSDAATTKPDAGTSTPEPDADPPAAEAGSE